VKVKVDGNQITPTFVAPGQQGEYAPLIYFDVTFDKNETKEIQVSYEGKAAGGYFLYVLNTGSYWKGPIGTLDMTFKFPYEAAAPNVFSITPGGYKIDGNEVVYHLVNYEPVQNIEVEFLPYYMYEKVNPLRLKAEATNNASDWFDYAMAFFPENPIGSMDEFVGWYRTPGFSDYVESILKKAVSLQEEGSPEQVVLQEVYSAHYEAPASFAEGLDAVLKLDGNHISLPSTSLDILRENIGSIENATEGKILGYVMEYSLYINNYFFAIINIFKEFFYLLPSHIFKFIMGNGKYKAVRIFHIIYIHQFNAIFLFCIFPVCLRINHYGFYSILIQSFNYIYNLGVSCIRAIFFISNTENNYF